MIILESHDGGSIGHGPQGASPSILLPDFQKSREHQLLCILLPPLHPPPPWPPAPSVWLSSSVTHGTGGEWRERSGLRAGFGEMWEQNQS